MSYGYESTNLSDTAREIKQYIYDSTIYEKSPEPLKGDASWWADQTGIPEEEITPALEELVASNTLIKQEDDSNSIYIYVPMTVVSPELHGPTQE